MKQPILCIFHDACFDGFASAWVVRRYYGADGVEFYPALYGLPPPQMLDREVLMVDFSYAHSIMEILAAEAANITVFDHHKTAKDAFEGLPSNVMATFDMERSGAGITWDVLFAGEPRPPLLDRIEARDLWKHDRYPDTRLVHAALESYPMDFEVWDGLMSMSLSRLENEGARCDALHWSYINRLLPLTTRNMRIDGRIIKVANLPITMCSDAGQELAKGEPFAATYMDVPHGRQFSLRSTEDGDDVSKIAAAYGKLFGTSGGGHPHAAGFIAPRNWEGDDSISTTAIPLLEHEARVEAAS